MVSLNQALGLNVRNGFVMPDTSMEVACELAETFGPYIRERAQGILAGFLAANRENPNAYAIWVTEQQNLQLSGRGNPLFNTGFALVLVPDGSRVMGVALTEQACWTEAWVGLPGILEYGYWETGPRPETVCKERWDVRRKDWARVTCSETLARRAKVIVLSEKGEVRLAE